MLTKMICIFILFALVATSAFGQNGNRIHRHKMYDTTRVEDFQKIKRRRLTVDIDWTGLTVDLWGGECFFKVKLRNRDDNMNHYETGERNGRPYVKYGNNKYRYRMYVNRSGNFEFDAIIRQKPASGRYFFPFNIQSQGLTFYYQDTLLDVDKLDSHRPDSVIGSYAVYHSTRKGNYIRLDETEENYTTGKAFHIYRPRVWDNAGDTVLGFIDIDTVLGRMKVGADSTWMANATYPVTIDPTVGLETEGATTSGENGDMQWWLGEWTTAGSGSGAANSVSIWINSASSQPYTLGIHGDSSVATLASHILDQGAGGTMTSSGDGFQTQDMVGGYTIENSTTYWFSIGSSESWNSAYDATGGYRRSNDRVYIAGDLQSIYVLGGGGSSDRTYSIYCTYGEGAPVTDISYVRRIKEGAGK